MIRAFVALALVLAPALASAGPRNDRQQGLGLDGSGNLAIPGAVDIAGAVEVSGTLAVCGPGDTVCLDNNGIVGAPASGTTDPLGVMLRGKPCSASDASGCVPGNTTIAGGTSVIDIQIDGADPSVSCAGDNDSVTYTVVDANGTAVISAVALTEGTQWTASASVATTCASLAAAFETACTVSGVDYCNATCSSPEVQVTLTPAAAAMTTLTESTAGCTTVSTLSYGDVMIAGSNLTTSTAAGPALFNRTGSTTSPTLVPDRSASTSGLSYTATQLNYVVAGVQEFYCTATACFLPTNVLEVTANVVRFPAIDANLTASCTAGQIGFDTATTKEFCYCETTNTWLCAAMTAGPAD